MSAIRYSELGLYEKFSLSIGDCIYEKVSYNKAFATEDKCYPALKVDPDQLVYKYDPSRKYSDDVEEFEAGISKYVAFIPFLIIGLFLLVTLAIYLFN